ncbi:MAG: GNAT family N-acetyltransferase [Spirochaetes bacterium]|nr:MAG: GNAT family N-acetyltransferase [Spirochaetota bacterium]
MEYTQQNYGQGTGKFENGIGALFARPYMLQLAGFKAKVNLVIDKGEYIIKTAESEFELEQALKLRHEVFIVELLGRKKLFGIDMDRYDTMCDHLMVFEKLSGTCVGTYRLNSSVYSTEFYSETEFSLGSLPGLEGNKLEIGRACIKKEFRRSNMMGLLWEGIYAYMGKIAARYVFGCSSIMTVEPLQIALAQRFLLNSGFHTNELGVQPRKKYAVKNLEESMKVIDLLGPESIREAAKKLVPRLILDYFNFGARVCGDPAVDMNFKCADVFTILDLSNLNNSYKEERFIK